MLRFCIFLAFLLLSNLILYGQHVLYGERNLAQDSNRIYFDKDGYIYPSYNISNTSLEQSNASIKKWYEQNENTFIQIGRLYHCSFHQYSDANFITLNDSIFANQIQKLNNSNQTTLSFFIHGYRKPFTNVNNTWTSQADFRVLTNNFKSYNHSNSKNIEVYWDAYHDCCFSANKKQNEYLFHLFELAQKNAELVGSSLKRVLCGIQKDTINIITHSLGAKVAMYSVLNISGNNSLTPTTPKLNLCLIAPAISPELISKNYWSRNSTVNYKNKDNYSLHIIYNEKDFVLKKRDNKIGILGPGPYKYGITTLGCNHHNSTIKLEKYFKTTFPQSPIHLYNMSYIGKCHHVRCYCDGSNMEETFRYMEK